MSAETAPDILARLLSVEREEACRRLDRFAGGMIAELLDRNRIFADGLGLFSVVHEQATREKTASGLRYLPPRNRVSFDERTQEAGDSFRIVTGRLGMESEEGRRFVQALATMFREMKKQDGRIDLRGFGSVATNAGIRRFQPDPSLEALFNAAYEGLHEIVIAEPEPSSAADKPVADKAEGGLKKVVVLVTVALLLVVGGMLYRQFSSGVSDASLSDSTDSGQVPEMTADRKTLALSDSGTPHAADTASSSADSVMLSKGRYTVIVATFNTRKVARQEMARLSGSGLRVMVWPVRQNGMRYYRLVLGDFETRLAALDSMKAISRSLYRDLYIQQAPKNVYIYGEQGL